jgi:hypothetical protein
MKQLWVGIVLALVAAASAGAAGNPIQTDPVVAKVADPQFLGSTAQCPRFRARTRLVSEDGVTLGSSMFCVTERLEDAAGTITQTGTLTLHLAGGALVIDATIVDETGVYPIVQTISGTVISGTGLYLGAAGTLSGGGTIVFDENGEPHPDSTLVVDLA